MEADPTLVREELPPERPGRVGPFRVLERIGAGGMGVVWLAERREPIEQRVALKVIRSDRLDKAYRARFEMEQQALSRMDHPNIARLLDAGDDAGQSWFAMEYVPGQPLADYCAEHRLSIEQRLALFLQICDGVQHAHVKGILHRDLKPGNILVREVDGRPVAKIIDFGLAQPVDPLQIRATLHESPRQIVGTFAYMSPEQALRTEGDLDTRSDVYSLGVVLYELLTGQLPIDLGEVERHGIAWFGEFLREHEPPKPSTRLSTLGDRLSTTAAERCLSPQRLRAYVRGELDWVTMKALARDRQRRYLTVQQLRGDVDRFLRHLPVEAGPPGWAYSARKWLRRHRTAVGMVGLGLGSLTGFGLQALANQRERSWHQQQALLDLRLLAAGELVTAAESIGVGPDCRQAVDAWSAQVAPMLREITPEVAGEFGADGPRRKAIEHFESSLRPRLEAAAAMVATVQELDARAAAAGQEHAAAWQRCIAAIVADERYGIAAMEPQYGLAPLGPDPLSRWQEFAVVATGELPARDPATGRLELDAHSALVLVLLPGGDFEMGADASMVAAGVVPDANEGPAHRQHVQPFLLAKSELTTLHCSDVLDAQVYWDSERFAAAGRLAKQAGVAIRSDGLERGLPLGGVDWHTARTTLLRLGLRLPSEAEWEYAARAGTTGAWSCAAEVDAVRKLANLPDASMVAAGLLPEEADARWLATSDGYPCVAPILAFAANPWGLHDLYGNVAEWCEDPFGGYGAAPAAPSHLRVVRGGSFWGRVADSRASARRALPAGVGAREVGLRAARSLTGAAR